MQFNFPRARFVDSNDIVKQSLHIDSEAIGVMLAVQQPGYDEVAMEIMDCLHSCETALRILQEKHGFNLNELRQSVERKNQERGYYA
jgi:hypothetical protein